MKILVITQKVDENDDNLGFFHGWLEEFSKQTDKVLVIAQFVGAYHLPSNVEVFSLGKEKGYSEIRQLVNFWKLLFRNLSKIDAVFAHMIPMWIVLGCPLFKFYRKNVYLWYVHKSVNLWLEIAEKCIKKIFTASKESCRLKSEKIVITGHGIDSDFFKPDVQKGKRDGKFKIISAGRITAVKNIDILIEAAEILKNKKFDFEIKVAGAPILEKDKIYFEKLENIIKEKKIEDKIIFTGAIPHKDIVEFYKRGDLFVNLSDTGSIDKAILEAMASGPLVLTSNEAFKNILPEKYFVGKNPEEIAQKIIALSKADFDPVLREYVIGSHGLKKLVEKLSAEMDFL
ncbi:MAG: glycosyltransferase family 4 protein [Candidatus Tagabacteria bacterium]